MLLQKPKVKRATSSFRKTSFTHDVIEITALPIMGSFKKKKLTLIGGACGYHGNIYPHPPKSSRGWLLLNLIAYHSNHDLDEWKVRVVVRFV